MSKQKKSKKNTVQIREEMLAKIESQARNLKERFSAIPVEGYYLNTDEQQELIRRGLTFRVDRMGKPHVGISEATRTRELREIVTQKRG